MASNITLRIPKGSKLSYQEGDNNFRDILKLYRFTEDTPTAAGTSDALTITSFNQPVAGYVDNMFLGFKASANNTTTTPTLDADGNGPVVIEKGDGSPLEAGNIVSGQFYMVRYDQSTNTFKLFGAAANVSAPVTSVNTLTGDVVLDYGNFDGAENIDLDNNIFVQGRDTTSALRPLVAIDDNDLARFGTTTLQQRLYSFAVPQTTYGGNTYDLITTEGGQTVEGDFSQSISIADTVIHHMGNSAGVVEQQLQPDGDLVFQQRSAAGVFENNWAVFNRNGTTRLFYNGAAKFNTESDGVSVTDAHLNVNGVSYSWPGADGSNGQVLTTSGAGTLTWQTPSSGGQVDSVVGSDNITVDDTDPANPIMDLSDNIDVTDGDIGIITAGTFPRQADLYTATADGAYLRLIDPSGGAAAHLNPSGQVGLIFEQMSETGIREHDWIICRRDSFVALTYNGAYQLRTTASGVLLGGFGPSSNQGAQIDVAGPVDDSTVSFSLENNQYLSTSWDGTNTSVSFQHNGSDVLTVDENGVSTANVDHGFFGATPVAQQSIDSSDTDTNRITALENALVAYGLVVDTAP